MKFVGLKSEATSNFGAWTFLLGGLHDFCEVSPKCTVENSNSRSKANQVLVGSPASIGENLVTNTEEWRPRRDFCFICGQLFGCLLILGVITGAIYAGALIGMIAKFGEMIFLLYLGSLFSYICGW